MACRSASILAKRASGCILEIIIGLRNQGRQALDRFRILALAKLLGDPALGTAKRAAAAEAMAAKCLIYSKGLARRGGLDEAAFFAEAARSALERWSGTPDAALTTACLRIRAMLKHCDAGPGLVERGARRDAGGHRSGQ